MCFLPEDTFVVDFYLIPNYGFTKDFVFFRRINLVNNLYVDLLQIYFIHLL